MKQELSSYLNKPKNINIKDNTKYYPIKNNRKSFQSSSETNNSLTCQNTNSRYSSQEKPMKKKLFKSVYTGYTKNTFGTIPYYTENFLIQNKIDNARFNDIKSHFYSDSLRNPGVGRYNLSRDMTIEGWSLKFGGEGNRFKTSFNNIPGVGDYNIEGDKVLEKERNNIRYQSLYKNKKERVDPSQTNTGNVLGPSSTTYTPIYQDDLIRLKKMYNFSSFIGRDNYNGVENPFSSSKNYPGPGTYFEDTTLFGSSKNNKQLKFSYENKDKSKENNLEKNKNKFYSKKDLPNFKLKSHSPKYNNFKIVTIEDVQLQNKLERQKLKKKNELNELLKKMPDKEKLSTNLMFKMEQERELNYIKSILGNDNGRSDLFYLSSPRWKENKYKFRTPGPAYYFNFLP